MNLQENPAPEECQRLQFEIQKANIHASNLVTRSYIVEKYWALCEAQNRVKTRDAFSPGSPGIVGNILDGMLGNASANNPDVVQQEMFDERESIIKDLLRVLSNINQVSMEPNGVSLVSPNKQSFLHDLC